MTEIDTGKLMRELNDKYNKKAHFIIYADSNYGDPYIISKEGLDKEALEYLKGV